MKPVYQDKFTKQDGNCFQAALASLLELSLNEVPDFVNDYPGDNDEWFIATNRWLRKYGFAIMAVSIPETPEQERAFSAVFCDVVYHIITGISKLSGCGHAVVAINGIMVHDPDPRDPEEMSIDPERYMFLIHTGNGIQENLTYRP